MANRGAAASARFSCWCLVDFDARWVCDDVLGNFFGVMGAGNRFGNRLKVNIVTETIMHAFVLEN